MKITRHFTKANKPIGDQIKWKITTAEIPGTFKQENIEVPEHWSQNAINILAQKYFRKAGIPEATFRANEPNIPHWLQPSVPTHNEKELWCGETSAKQVFHRLTGHWTYTGWKEGYFSSEKDAQIFYDEIYYMLAMQIAAPNSPQWFNTGLWWAYGIEGSNSGQWRCDPKSGKPIQLENSYEFPQVHACFINSLSDNLVDKNGIFDLLFREARIFKYGSGAGSNFSRLRGGNEKLSGGGRSSGMMSFLEIYDKAAGAIQSGGTTRRAAKMVVVDANHPEIEDFINWKVREENKAAAMYIGSVAMSEGTAHDSNGNTTTPQTIIDRSQAGIKSEIFDIGWEGEALRTVSGQNSNNSIRFHDAFMERLEIPDSTWNLINRTDRNIAKTIKTKDLWDKLCTAAWACADPGVQFHNNINKWNTCANDGEIVSTNPCGEYNFLDDTACNLASMNLVNGWTSTEDFIYITRMWMIVLDISVSMASFPSEEIAIGSWKYRTTGLGYANLGALLMRAGIPYDSEEARILAATITAIMHGVSYKTSNELAEDLGAFPRYEANKSSMENVIRLHFDEAKKYGLEDYYRYNGNAGFRNAQTTLIAPTGTISFVMDCDTTGIEPDFDLVKFKALAGGGSMFIINESIEPALQKLGYSEGQTRSILTHINEYKTIKDCIILQPSHQPVFATANDISYLGHLKMMAVVQPFLSGAISKTVSLAANSTPADVDAVYKTGWKFGLKCIALYRDGSKLTQPLMRVEETNKIVSIPQSKLTQDTISEIILPRGVRRRLPSKCFGYRRNFKVNGHSIFMHTGEYSDKSLGEIFLELSREGSTLRAFGNAFAIAVSLGLQYGVPIEEFVEAFIHTKFEPAGIVEEHEQIKMCSSILDAVVRELGIQYLKRADLANDQNAVVQVSVDTVTQIGTAREAISYKIVASGDVCWDCGNATLVRTGGSGCVTCNFCGANSGCS